MAASQPGTFNIQEFTDLGVLAVGGRIYTYTQGTTTFKTAYTDQAGVTSHTYTSDGIGGQYIALNARGELPAPLYLSSGSYDITYKDSLGATVWTRRADPQSSSSSSLTDFPASFAGAALKRLRVNAGATAIEYITDSLANLVDGFAVGVGNALKYVRVNAAGTALEAATLTITNSLLQLLDNLSGVTVYTGKAGQSVVVNAAETGWTFDGVPLGQAKYRLSGNQTFGVGDTTVQFTTLASTGPLRRGTFNSGTYTYTAGSGGAEVYVSVLIDINPIGAGVGGNVFIMKNAAKDTQGIIIDYASSGTNEMTATAFSLISLNAGETISIKYNGNGQIALSTYSLLVFMEMA